MKSLMLASSVSGVLCSGGDAAPPCLSVSGHLSCYVGIFLARGYCIDRLKPKPIPVWGSLEWLLPYALDT